MIAALVCREMKWTLDEYLEQPAAFIETVISLLRQEAHAAEKRQRDSRQQ